MWRLIDRAVLLACLAASGAAVAADPTPPDPTTYAMAGDAAPTLDPSQRVGGAWWKALGSPALNDVIAQALKQNPTLEAARARIDEAKAEEARIAGARLPQVDANAGILRNRINFASFGFTQFPNPTITNYSIGGTVAYDLDIFGSLRRRHEAARANTRAETHRADAAYLTVTGQIAYQAVVIATIRERVESAKAIIADDQALIDLQQAAIAAGGEAPSSSVSRTAQLRMDEANLRPLERALAQARHGLSELVGLPPAQWTAPEFALSEFQAPASPADLPSGFIRRRPDIAAAEDDLKAALSQTAAAKADLYPAIRLFAGIQETALEPENLFTWSSTGWSTGANALAPLFHGGSLKAALRGQQARATQAAARYREAVLAGFVQTADVLSDLAQDDQRLADLAASKKAAESMLNDAQAALDIGGGSRLDVAQAQRRLDMARMDYAGALGARLADIVDLYAVSATEWRDRN
jgi:NodT family efflux transporter outer membrane factor (OMF) lipoprotein